MYLISKYKITVFGCIVLRNFNFLEYEIPLNLENLILVEELVFLLFSFLGIEIKGRWMIFFSFLIYSFFFFDR